MSDARIIDACRTPRGIGKQRKVALDRFCGSGISSANIAATAIMAGMEVLVVSGRRRRHGTGDHHRAGLT